MGKVLYVATWNPFTSGGGSQATRAFLDATLEVFGKDNVDVIINHGVSIPESYKASIFIEVPPRSRLKSLFFFIFGVLGSHTMPTLKIIKNNPDRYDWIIFNGGREAGWCFKRLKKFTLNKVVIHHNQEVEFCMDTRSIYTLGNKWPYTVRHEEKNAFKFSDFNLFLTKQDMEAFPRMYGSTKARNSLLGTFDFKDREIEIINKENKQFDISVSGSLVDYQTTVGIQDFYNRYFPLVEKLLPDVKILFTGRNPSRPILDIVASNKDHFSIVANPTQILSVVQKGRIYLCPTCIGGGLKLRAMDGLKCGLPVLVHEVSARGYDFYFSKPYFKIYNDEYSFEKGLKEIISYLEDNSDSSIIINRDYYEYFGYSKGVERMKQILLREL